MDTVSRRGLFGLFCGLGGAAVAGAKPSPADTATVQTAPAKQLEPLRRSPMSDDAVVFETYAKFEWLDLNGRYGFMREVGSDRRILVHVACLNASEIKTISTDAIYRCQVLRRTKGLQAFRIVDVIESSA